MNSARRIQRYGFVFPTTVENLEIEQIFPDTEIVKIVLGMFEHYAFKL